MTVEIRALHGSSQMRALSQVLGEIWGSADERLLPKETLVAASLAGHQVLGAFDGDTLIGGSWAFLCWDGATMTAHSHVTGVLEPYRGVAGYALKMAQRDWCLARGISTVTWTFDPMIARNAAFNLRKLGATGVAFHANFYGSMRDHFNAGEPTDRIEVRWDLESAPRTVAPPRAGKSVETVFVPADYLALRSADPPAALAAREHAGRRLGELMGAGYRAVWFDAERGYSLVKGVT